MNSLKKQIRGMHVKQQLTVCKLQTEFFIHKILDSMYFELYLKIANKFNFLTTNVKNDIGTKQ
jgi:hypothetical protein